MLLNQYPAPMRTLPTARTFLVQSPVFCSCPFPIYASFPHTPTSTALPVRATVAPPPPCLVRIAYLTPSLLSAFRNMYFWLQILIPHSCPPFLSPPQAFMTAECSLHGTFLVLPSSCGMS